MRDRKGGGFADGRMPEQCGLDLVGRDLLPATFDRLLRPSYDGEEPVGVNRPKIAGEKPSFMRTTRRSSAS